MDRCNRVVLVALAVLGLSLAPFAESAIARPIFTLGGLPPATGMVALPDGNVVGTQPFDDAQASGGPATWKLRPNGRLQVLSEHGGSDITLGPGGRLFVADGESSVLRLSPGGGAVAVATGLMSPLGISAMGDGRLLVAEYSRNRIVSLAQDGTVTPVAGTGEPAFSGDGELATQARLRSPTDVAATADGGFLIADAGNFRVRKVDAGGMITTVAGSGQRGSLRDGIDATEAQIGVAEVVAGAHGGFAFASAGGVRRVTRDGIIRTVAGGRPFFSSAMGMGIWNGDGSNAERARLDDFGAPGLAITPEDDYLLSGRAMRFMPSPITPRLAVAARVVLPVRRRLSYLVTQPAALRLELRGLHGRIALVQRADAGRGRFRFPRSLPPGPYLIRLQAHGSDGQRASQTLGMFYGRRLPRPIALAGIRAGSGPLIFPRGRSRMRLRSGTVEDNPVGPCRRMSTRRIDCRTWVDAVDAPRECVWNVAIFLDSRWGQLGFMGYPCGRIRRRPPDPFGPSLVGIIDSVETDAPHTAIPFPAPPAARLPARVSMSTGG